MIAFWKSRPGLVLAAVLVFAAAAAVGWRNEMRSAAREERETQQRIQGEVEQSIDKAMGGLKLCPLSDPDCNKR